MDLGCKNAVLLILCMLFISCVTKSIKEEEKIKKTYSDDLASLDKEFARVGLDEKLDIINSINEKENAAMIFIVMRALLFQKIVKEELDEKTDDDEKEEKRNKENKEINDKISKLIGNVQDEQQSNAKKIIDKVEWIRIEEAIEKEKEKEENAKIKQLKIEALVAFDKFRVFALAEDFRLSFYSHIDNWFNKEHAMIIEQMGLSVEYERFIKNRKERGFRVLYYKKYPLEFLFDTGIMALIWDNILSDKVSSLVRFWSIWIAGYKKDNTKIETLTGILHRKDIAHKKIIDMAALWALSQFDYEYLDGFKLGFIKNDNEHLKEIAMINFAMHNKASFAPLFLKMLGKTGKDDSDKVKMGLISALIMLEQDKKLISWILESPYDEDSTLVRLYKIYGIKAAFSINIIPTIVIEGLYNKENPHIQRAAFELIKQHGSKENASILYPILEDTTASKLQIDTLKLIRIWKDAKAIPYIKKLINTLSLSQNEDKKSEDEQKDEADQGENKGDKKDKISEEEKQKIAILKRKIVGRAIKAIGEIGYYDKLLTELLYNDDFTKEQKVLSIEALSKIKDLDKEKDNIYDRLKLFYKEYLITTKKYPYTDFVPFRQFLAMFGGKEELLSIINNEDDLLAIEAVYTLPAFKKSFDDFDFLFLIIGKSKNTTLGAAIVTALGDIRYEKALELFINIAKSQTADRILKKSAIYALGKMKSKKTLYLIMSYLDNPGEELIIQAIKTLGYMKDKRAVSDLEERYDKTKSPNEKLAIIFTLIIINEKIGQDFIKDIIKIATTQNKSTKSFVLSYLDAIKKEDIETEKLIKLIIIKTNESNKQLVEDFLTKKEDETEKDKTKEEE